MKSNDPKAKNLFARLTSLTATEGSRKIENFCTETLAWCLLVSPEFRKGFLAAIGMTEGAFEYHLDTQVFCKTGREKCYLDILLRPKDAKGNTFYVIEVKVWSKFSHRSVVEEKKERKTHQLDLYKSAVEKSYPAARNVVKISLTVDTETEQADIHLFWSDIDRLLCNPNLQADYSQVFRDFSKFLRSKNMGSITFEPLTPIGCSEWHKTNTRLNQAQRMFDRISQLDKFKALFRKKKLLTTDSDEENKRSWFGMHSSNFYIGIAFYSLGENTSVQPLLYLEYYGAHLKKVARDFQRGFSADFDFAKNYHCPADSWINTQDRDAKTVVLMAPLKNETKDNAQEIINWFTDRLDVIKEVEIAHSSS